MSLWSSLRRPVLPAAPVLPRHWDMALAACLATLGFVLPFSVAGVVALLVVLAVFAFARAGAVWRLAPWREPTLAAGLLLLAYVTAHTLWTTGWTTMTGQAVNRYHELLMAPVLFALFRLVSRKDAFLWGLAAGAVFYAAVHWVAIGIPRLAAYLEPRHISAGFALALCSFVLLEHARGQPRPWLWRALAALLAVTVLFAIEGRTGHVVLLLLVALAGWLHSPRRWRLAAMVALPLAVVLLALGSSAVQKRVAETWAGLTGAQPDPQSSTRIRMELVRNGLYLAREHYGAGAGYTRYAEVHADAVHRRYGADPAQAATLKAPWVTTPNPHNEYLMHLVGGGSAALALFLAWLSLPLLRRQPGAGASPVLVAAVLAFALGCLFNSMLMDFVEGHFYVALLAWLLARTAEAPA